VGTYSYDANQNATVSAIAGAGYVFSYWLVDGSNAGAANPISVSMSSDRTVQPVFAVQQYQQYTLTASAGVGGYTNPSSQQCDPGTNATVEAIPYEGYIFDHWNMGNATYYDSEYTHTMTNNYTVEAIFRRQIQRDERLAGEGSKQTTIPWNATRADVIVQVESNFQNWASSAVIENLVIDGQNHSFVTGILLEDVYNCSIRNVTIKNCDVGITVKAKSGKWCESNSFSHIRMENVGKGIQFVSDDSNASFSYTKISDVGIELSNSSTSAGRA
jgi:hypothetical protein